MAEYFDINALKARVTNLEKTIQETQGLRERIVDLERPGFIAVVRLTRLNYALTWRQNAEHILILCDATDGAFTVQLPSAKATRNVILIFKKNDATANVVTVSAVAEELIDAALTKTLSTNNETFNLISDGLIWRVAG